jgi:hypothetical protein
MTKNLTTISDAKPVGINTGTVMSKPVMQSVITSKPDAFSDYVNKKSLVPCAVERAGPRGISI